MGHSMQNKALRKGILNESEGCMIDCVDSHLSNHCGSDSYEIFTETLRYCVKNIYSLAEHRR